MKRDMGKAKKKDRPVYSVADNVLFLLKRIRRESPVLLVFMGIESIFSVAGPVAGIWLPKVVVELAQERASLTQIAVQLGGVGGIMALSMALASMAGQGKYMKQNNLCHLYKKDLFMVSLCCEYAQIEGMEGQRRYERARETLDEGDLSGCTIMCNQSVKLLINLGCFVIYSGVISTLDVWVMILLVGLSLISLLAVRGANAWEFRHKDQEAALAGKLNYIEWTARDAQYGKDIRLYGMGPWLLRLQDQVLESWTRLSYRIRNRYFAAGAVNAATLFFRDGMVYGYLIGSAAAGKVTAPDFVLYFGAATGLSAYVGKMVNNLNDLHRSNLMMNDMRAFPDSAALEERQGEQRKQGKEKDVSIDFEHVTFSYPVPPGDEKAEPVLKDFNLPIRGGEKVALVGANGAGKTTVVKLLCGFYQPDEGRILINGRDLRDFSGQERYALFSTVFQDIYIPPFTVAENVSMKPEADTDMERVIWCLQQAGLYDKICKFPEGIHSYMLKAVHDGIMLSGGEQQKLLMARALYKDAPVLVLDEPTAALDPIAESETYESFHRLTSRQPSAGYVRTAGGTSGRNNSPGDQESGAGQQSPSGKKTAIYISHRLASTRFCDRIVLLEDGRVKEEGSHQELMEKNGAYARMYEIQSRYYRRGAQEGEEAQGK